MTNIRVLYLVGFYSLLATTAASLKTQKIIGDLYARNNEFKHVVSIRSKRIDICGGSLVSDDAVLTAAHCFFRKGKFKDKGYNIVAGTIYSKEKYPKITSSIERVYISINYKPNNNGVSTADIAVARLGKSLKVENNPRLGLVKLPSIDYKYNQTLEGVVAGFGFDKFWHVLVNGTDYIKGSMDGYLRYGTLKLQPSLEGSNSTVIYGVAVQCFNGTFIGVCTGDSGASVVKDGITYATVVSGSTCNQTEINSKSVLIPVGPYVNFIKAAIEDEPTEETVIYLLFPDP